MRAVSKPCQNGIGQDTLYEAVVEALQELGRNVVSLQCPEKVQSLLNLLQCSSGVYGPFQIIADVSPETGKWSAAPTPGLLS